MSKFMSAVLQPLKFLRLNTPQISASNSLVKPDSSLLSIIRTNVRCHFPRPNEVRRVRRHGWAHRMSTLGGRKIIMRRLLKGKFVLTH